MDGTHTRATRVRAKYIQAMKNNIDKMTIERVKSAADIVDVVGDFVELHKRGIRYLGLCPFHHERHLGSFVVYPRDNVFKCFTCDAKGGPIEFLMRHEGLTFPDAIRWLGKKYGIYTDTSFTLPPSPPRAKADPLPMLTLPWSMVTSHEHTEQNTLVNWLKCGINWDECQLNRIDQVLHDYHVGHARQGHTIWWQIDERQRVRTGKMMLYREDGHRDKTPGKYTFDWIHSALFRDRRLTQYDDKKQEMQQTLFGMHLLDKFRGKARQKVCIVESEKTAVIMAIAYGNHPMQVWMACGGLENLSRDRLAPIIAQGREIVLYPDRDGIDRWKQKAKAIHYEHLHVDTEPVLDWWQPEDGEKADIADVVIRMIGARTIYKSIEQVIEAMPVVKNLHKELHLQVVQQ